MKITLFPLSTLLCWNFKRKQSYFPFSDKAKIMRYCKAYICIKCSSFFFCMLMENHLNKDDANIWLPLKNNLNKYLLICPKKTSISFTCKNDKINLISKTSNSISHQIFYLKIIYMKEIHSCIKSDAPRQSCPNGTTIYICEYNVEIGKWLQN